MGSSAPQLHGHRACFAFALLISCALPVFAQEPGSERVSPEMDALVANVAKKIQKESKRDSKPWSLMILDFGERGKPITQLAPRLSRDFAAALATRLPGLKILSRECAMREFAQEKLDPNLYGDIHVLSWIAGLCGATEYVQGIAHTKGGQILLELHFYRQSDDKGILRVIGTLPITAEFLQLAAQPIQLLAPTAPPAPARPTQEKQSFPECLKCPDPDYSPEARKYDFNGSLLLRITVTTEGEAADILILRGVPYGLNEASIRIIRTWKFKPAKNQAGEPVSMTIPVEFNFRRM